MNMNDIRIFARCLGNVGKILFLSLFSGYLAGGIAIAAQECVPAGVALPNPQGVVMELTGDVKATVGRGATCAVSKGQTVVSDTLITTGTKSSVVLRFADGQGVSLQENSSFHIQQYVFDQKNAAKSNIVFALLKGGARFVTGVIGQKNKDAFKLTAGTTTIGIRGTAFALAVLANGSVIGTVTDGAITIGGQTFAVGASFTASIGANGALTVTPGLPAGVTSATLAAPGVAPAGVISIPAGATAGTASSATGAAAAAGTGVGAGFSAGAVAAAVAIAAAVAAAAAQNNDEGTTTGTTGTTGSTGTQ